MVTQDTATVSFDDFRINRILQDATTRRFEIIGEAVKHIPESVRSKYPGIPWQEIAGFRDVLIHDYPEIIIDDVYHTAREDLPTFRDQVAKVLKDLQKE